MENFLKRKEGRNPLIFLGLSAALTAVILLLLLLLFNSSEPVYQDKLTVKVYEEEVVSKEITLLFAGDIMLSRAVGAIMEKSDNWEYPFSRTALFLRSADLTFGNLESPISGRGVNVGSIYSFRANPRAVEGLRYAGFDVLSLANNHIWDYGMEAFTDTIQILESLNISPVGGGLNYELAHKPVIKNAGGTKIAYLAYTSLGPVFLTSKEAIPAVAFLDLETAISDVKAAKAQADVVVVSLHWGNEYEQSANNYQKTVSRALIDVGADLIVGHHPHVVQEIEKYAGGFIAYSLGNFVFDQNFSEETMRGIILRAIIKDKKIKSVETIKIKINNSFQPVIADY